MPEKLVDLFCQVPKETKAEIMRRCREGTAKTPDEFKQLGKKVKLTIGDVITLAIDNTRKTQP